MTSSTPFELDRSLLTGRVAVVTGASRGLGAGLATRFAEHGLALGLCARTEPELPDGSSGVTASVDVTDADAVEQFARQVGSALGRIDIWVNNAGVIDPMGPQRDHDPPDVARALLVNVGGVANGTRSFTNFLTARSTDPGPPRPLLVNISSGAATSTYSGWSIYGAAKAAVDQFTRVVAVEEPMVRCHSVAPGVIDTDMQASIRTHDARTFPAIERFRALHASGGWNSPSWVADHLLGLFTTALRPDDVVLRVPPQPTTD